MVIAGVEIREDVESFIYLELFDMIFFDTENNNYEVSCSKKQYDKFLKVLFSQTEQFISLNNGTIINLYKVKYIDMDGIDGFARIVFENKVFLVENRTLRGMVKISEVMDRLECYKKLVVQN